ncbi:hypothetical protein JXA32_10420 [Candidatus Sumerlaeota bacterium]|nr:hypothetical protein [Candidatus Sumerlaeota bacterium]
MNDMPLGDDAINYLHEGRLIRFCCKGCQADFAKSPEKYLKALDAAVIKNQVDKYPLDTCVVSGAPLDGMGAPKDFVYRNRLVRFCCSGCEKTFLKDPAKYLEKIDAAMAE